MEKIDTYVSLGTAKLLKEAGFNVEVIGSYDLASRDDFGEPGKFMRSGTLRKWNYNAHDYTISAPTLKEAADWLRSVKKIKVEEPFDEAKIDNACQLIIDRAKTLEEIGKEDYKESSYCAGVEHEKKVAINACKKVIDTFYNSNFDPTIDYMKIFVENL